MKVVLIEKSQITCCSDSRREIGSPSFFKEGLLSSCFIGFEVLFE